MEETALVLIDYVLPFLFCALLLTAPLTVIFMLADLIRRKR